MGFCPFFHLYIKLCSATGHLIKNEIQDIYNHVRGDNARELSARQTASSTRQKRTRHHERLFCQEAFGSLDDSRESASGNLAKGILVKGRYIYPYPYPTQSQAWQANRYPYPFLPSPSQASALSHLFH
ncbi:hypothetical protein E4U13_002537 [Claviceps humidiphila]|uniref:Uncharacterized protein n=1 Tax=Claviceps humidiphila TaxID=1294629 RepID=A0A9P7Q6K4_9HYPO|nr:hypothetical protein E4U13_002537 [Claviceps humidiphila]